MSARRHLRHGLLAAIACLSACGGQSPPEAEVRPSRGGAPAAAQRSMPPAERLQPGQFLRQWVLCGPFSPAKGAPPDAAALRGLFDTDFLAEQGGERRVRPAPDASAPGSAAGCAWRALASGQDRVDLAAVYGAETDGVAYAWTEVDAPAAATVLLGVASDDAVKVWLNGALIHENWVARRLEIDQDLALAPLHPGRNQLLVKVQDHGQAWEFAVRPIDVAAIAVDRVLLRAAARGRADLVQFLLENGARADARDADGWTALHAAAARGDRAVAQLLLARGAVVDARSVHGLTPLHVAGASGQAELAAVLTAAGADARLRPPGRPEEIARLLRVRPLFADYVGGGALVIDRGKVIFKQAFGLASLEENQAIAADTNFRLASVTKQFTAMAVMILVDRKRLSLDTTLDRLFPGFPAYGAAITVRHLLTHTSGLPAYEGLIPEGTVLPLQDLDVLQMLLSTSAPEFPAGARFEYSNTGYALLALIVEKVSGAPFARFLEEQIFRPLGMRDTVAFVPGWNQVARRAYGYSRDGLGWRRTDQSITSAVLGDGGIYTSLDDMAKWIRALDEHRLVSRAAYKQITTPTVMVDSSTGAGYGFGWFVDTWKGHRRVYHSGHTIGFTLNVQRLPDRGAAVVVLTNESRSTAGATAESLLEIFFADGRPGQTRSFP